MTELLCIGLIGQKGQGKDEVSNYLSKLLKRIEEVPDHPGEIQYNCWGRGSFAAPVKKLFSKMFGVGLDFIEEWKNSYEPPPGFAMNVRDGLTFIGDGFRRIKPRIWIDMAFDPANDPYYKVYSDARYINEWDEIKYQKGVNILLYRPGYVNEVKNASESELRPYLDWCVNTGEEGVVQEFSAYQQYKKAVEKGVADEAFFDRLSLIDLFVRNDGSLEDLHRKTREIIVDYLVKNFAVETTLQ